MFSSLGWWLIDGLVPLRMSRGSDATAALSEPTHYKPCVVVRSASRLRQAMTGPRGYEKSFLRFSCCRYLFSISILDLAYRSLYYRSPLSVTRSRCEWASSACRGRTTGETPPKLLWRCCAESGCFAYLRSRRRWSISTSMLDLDVDARSRF